ncbi:hypothetical protein IMCC1989_1766 [gamma proteobacterium IMCC1989]|nr:hypothetical protein IMCC1989_1766 [gamma proteobacterium IMCC1989]
MLKSLVRNTTFNLIAFGIAGVLGLLIASLTVKEYGLYFYGIIVFSRNFIPHGFLGLFDLGIPDSATRLIANSIAEKNQQHTNQYTSAVIILGAAIGLISFALLSITSNLLSPILLSLERPEEVLQFGHIIFWSGVASLILIPSLFTEGVLKGMNQFPAIRIGEIFSNVLFFILVLTIIWEKLEYYYIVYAFLTCHIVRAIINFSWLFTLYKRNTWSYSFISPLCRSSLYQSCKLLFKMKLVSSLASFLPPIIIGQVIGPAGIGAYDILMRIPRLIKSVVGVTTQAIVPSAAVLNVKNNDKRLGKLGTTGTYLILITIIPIITFAILASDMILGYWLGTDHSDMGTWFKISLIWPIFIATYQVTSTVLIVKTSALKALNKVNIAQVSTMLILALSLIDTWEEKSFIIAYLAAEVIFIPYRVYMYCKYVNLNTSKYWATLLRVSIPALVSIILPAMLIENLGSNIITLITSITIFILSYYFILFLSAGSDEKSAINDIVHSFSKKR